MKIIIYSPINPTHEYQIFSEDRVITNRNSNLFPRQFDESEILTIIGGKAFKKFEKGQSTFDVPAWKIKAVEGVLNPTKNFQLHFIEEYAH